MRLKLPLLICKFAVLLFTVCDSYLLRIISIKLFYFITFLVACLCRLNL